VEKVLKYKNEKGKDLFRIKWKGYDSKQNTWEPIENLRDGASELALFQLRLSFSL